MCSSLYSELYTNKDNDTPFVTSACLNTEEFSDSYFTKSLACVQEDYETNDVTLDWQGGCSNLGDNYVISCFMYASIGQTSGACSQFEEDQDCNFADGDQVEELPESIGDQCIGQAECDIKLTSQGWTVSTDGGSTYSNPVAYTNLTSGVNKLKFIVACAENNVDYTDNTDYGFWVDCFDSDGLVKYDDDNDDDDDDDDGENQQILKYFGFIAMFLLALLF